MAVQAGHGGRRARDTIVCRVEDLPPGSHVVVPVGKFGVGVYNVDGELYAINNYCPHMGGPVCLGNVYGTNIWSNQEMKVEHVREGRIIRCPWHAWEFDLTTGDSPTDTKKRIRAYQVRVENGEVVLSR
jgi:nitrite reductase/ring-hydroxylating ferredoxin subunit